MIKKMIKIGGLALSLLAFAGCSYLTGEGSDSAEVIDGSGRHMAGVRSMGLGENASLQGVNLNAASDQTNAGQVVYFGFDQYTVDDQYQSVIEANARYLVGHPNASMRIEGYTDEVGSREYNIALGEHRADNVRNALELQGVSPDQLTTVSYGMEYPVASCAGKKRCELNRRAVLVFTSKG